MSSAAATPRSRFRLSFGLGHLLTLMAGLGVGMAIMQPWKSWERPPIPVDYEVAVVRVLEEEVGAFKISSDRASEIRSLLLKGFGPDSASRGESPIGELLGTNSLSTIEGEAGVMEVTLPLKAAGGRTKPDQFTIEVKPFSARGEIKSGVKATFSWAPGATPNELKLWQASGATEVLELCKIPASSESDQPVRIYLVITPQDAQKRQFSVKAPSTSAVNPSSGS